MLPKIQYISQGATPMEHFQNCKKVLEMGVKFIQLRMKNASKNDIVMVAKLLKPECKKHHALLIINDHVDLAKELNVDGVHLGLDDCSIAEAREILGNEKIIGGTANTLDHVLQRIDEKCDYIGLGPYRFTTTKEKLSPILGIEGYSFIINELVERNLRMPMYAIGGIESDDIDQLFDLGIHGIAVSGMLTKENIDLSIVHNLLQESANQIDIWTTQISEK